MNKALLDTDIYSEVLKAKNPTVTHNATLYRQQHGVYTVSVITVMEVVQGFHRVQNARRLLSFLNAVALEQVIVFDQPAAELAGRISGDLDRTGQSVGLADPMIAATGDFITERATGWHYIKGIMPYYIYDNRCA